MVKRAPARAPAAATSGADPHARLAQGGRRMTPQRAAVYAYLRSVHHHPTAEEVYLAVKRRLPRVSLATVYNALEVLVRSGLAAKLAYGDASARYDSRTDPHSHVRCVDCGRVEDLEAVPGERWLRSLDTGEFQAHAFRFELLGRCRACRG